MGSDSAGKTPVRDRAGDIFGMTDRANAGGADILQQYPPRSAVVSWIFFYWAAQPYFTLITTFVFAPYFASFVAPDRPAARRCWDLPPPLPA
jgi:hypothetical protein